MPSGAQSSTESLPASLQAILAGLSQLDTGAQALVRDVTDEQANWQPNAGKGWSIAQCLDHIGKTNVAYIDAMRSALSASGQISPVYSIGDHPIRPGWFSRLFLWSIEPPPRLKIPAPPKILPASQIPRDKALGAFLDSQVQIRSLLPECSRCDLNRLRFQNPFIPGVKFTVGTGLLVMLAHGRRHLWQAGRVLESVLQVRS